MKVGVLGMGHFAGVVAMCLADKGHDIVQWDEHPPLLREGHPRADEEPGYQPYSANRVFVTCDPRNLTYCDLLWACWDAPLDTRGRADPANVIRRLGRLVLVLPVRALIVASCQWPVGTTRQLQQQWPSVRIAYVMENVRVGHAIDDFLLAPAMMVGVRPEQDREVIVRLLAPFATRIEWMSTESAELAKHTLNAWLGLQIAFINEIARVSHVVGADAEDVARALFADARVSPLAPLHPGPPFGGGSLQRDILQLMDLSDAHGVKMPIVRAILASNTP